MAKATHAQSARSRPALGWALPVVTLGLYGLPRLRPRSLYVAVVLLILALWLTLGLGYALTNPGTEPLVAPFLFVAVLATFLRLSRPGAK